MQSEASTCSPGRRMMKRRTKQIDKLKAQGVKFEVCRNTLISAASTRTRNSTTSRALT